MTITTIKYTDADRKEVRVTYIDGVTSVTALPSGDGPTQRAIDAALAEGLVIEPYAPPPPPEPTIHMAWFRAALAEANYLSIVEEAVDVAGPVQRQLWDYASSIRRNHPTVLAIAAQLNINLDIIFARAEAIRSASE